MTLLVKFERSFARTCYGASFQYKGFRCNDGVGQVGGRVGGRGSHRLSRGGRPPSKHVKINSFL